MKWERAVLPVALLLGLGQVPGAVLAKEGSGVSAQQALQKLLEGNKRYAVGRAMHPNCSVARRGELAKGQKPFAAVLSCADSRIPPELVFDQGLGDLFVVRVAGNVVSNEVEGSLEYAAEHLGTALIVVLGHKRCGAVSAAVEGKATHTHIDSLIDALRPAVAQVKGQPGDALDNAVRTNVRLTVNRLKESQPVLAEMVKEGKLQVVGAYYDLDTGLVEIFPQ